ncbi:unnamed protein product, partial [Ixodes hexagonus]
YCCPDVASKLTKAANFSLNPCRNFVLYTCHNWLTHRNRISNKHSPETVHRSAISGRFGSAAGQTIFAFHRSCLHTIGRGSELPARAMSALLEAINMSRGMAPVDVLRILIQLSVLYQLYTPIKVDVRFDAASSVSTLVVQSNPVPPFSDSEFMDVHKDMLTTFNQKLRVTMSTEEFLSLKEKLHTSNQKGQQYVVKTFAPLDSLVASVSKRQWLAMAAPFHYFPPPTVLSYSDIGHIRGTLHLLTTDSKERREVQMALLVIMAGVHLIRNYKYRVPIGESTALFRYCGELTDDLASSWRILTKQELTDPQKDDVVRSLYDEIKNAVVLDMQKLFDPADWTAAGRVLFSVRLVLPADLIPRDVSVPILGENFYSNVLEMKLYSMAEQKRLVELGFDLLYDYDVFNTNPEPLGKNAVLMPSMSYSLLRFVKGTDPAVNAADVGAQMAFFLWRVLFDSKDWTSATRDRIKDHHECSTGNVSKSRKRRVPMGYTMYRLSLHSAVDAVRTQGPEWHLPLYVWSTSRLSRAQMFYMDFTFKYCPIAMNDSRAVTMINALLPSIRDFREAYAC